MVDVIGIEQLEDSKEFKLSMVTSNIEEANQGGGKPQNQYFEDISKDIYTAAHDIELQMAGKINLIEDRLFLFNKSFAKNDLGEQVSFVGKIPSSPLVATAALFDGDIAKLLQMKELGNTTVSEYLIRLLDQATEQSSAPKVLLSDLIFSKADKKQDIALPLLEMKEQIVRLKGSSLFSAGIYSGVDLDVQQTELLLSFSGQKKRPLMYSQIHKQSIVFIVKKIERQMRIQVDRGGKLHVELPLRMLVQLGSNGDLNGPVSTEELHNFERLLSEDYTNKAEKMMHSLQEANCDFLGIGQHVYAHHPKLWASLNWREQYPKIAIVPKVKISIVDTGTYDNTSEL
jgi:Ger(x)C family germination protein